jgi:NarL family two-component system sensor histidine kinase YdfH
MTTYHPARSQNDLLRWYLLLWVCLIALWGFFEISNRAVSAAWHACSTGSGAADMCAQLKQHLGAQGQPDLASLPPAVLTTLLARTIIIFSLLLLLYGILLWLSLLDRKKRRLAWFALCVQGALACALSFFVPALSMTVPVSLLLVLILEACAIFRQMRTVLAFSCGAIVIFLLSAVLALRQGYGLNEGSLTIVIALILLVVGFLFVGGFFLLYRRVADMHATIETAYIRLAAANERIEALTLITERQRMARELHDTLAQGLAGIILQLGVIHARVKEQHYDGIQSALEQTLTSARETLADARSAIDDLRTTAPIDLLEAAQQEVQRFTLLAGIPCTAELDLLAQIPPGQAEQVIGMIRESLTNIARHAQASHACVRVFRDGQALQLEIGDDGIGFDPTLAGTQPGHYGLPGLHERARLAGGQLTVMSAPGQGTRVQLSLPGSCKSTIERRSEV